MSISGTDSEKESASSIFSIKSPVNKQNIHLQFVVGWECQKMGYSKVKNMSSLYTPEPLLEHYNILLFVSCQKR